MTDIDFTVDEFTIDITDEVKHLHDEHRRLAENFRESAFGYEGTAATAMFDGDVVEAEAAQAEASLDHERADLHEHTANVLAIILGLGEEEAA